MIATQASSPTSLISHFKSNSTSSTSPASPPRGRRPSISSPIAWLSRTSSSHSHTHSAAGAMRISEPQLVNDLYAPISGPPYMHQRYGALGTGATVVRTPQDALTRAAMAAAAAVPHEVPGAADDDGSSYDDEPEPHSPSSPALPPLPFTSKSSPNLPALGGRDSPSPIRAPPSRAPPPVPTLPLFIDQTPPQVPFVPVLLAPVPEVVLDPSSLIVTLETSTAALRTTFATLTSRPSYLGEYLQTIVRNAREREKRKFRDTLVEEEEEYEETFADEDDDGHRLSSPNTPFTSLFNAHLATAGLLPQAPGLIHLFLDRPSAPYAHIIAYLRTPPEHPALPRAVTSHDRLEDLLELRDEACYLGLEELHRLCCDMLRRRQGHVRGSSSGQVLSVHDQPEVRLRAVARHHPQDVPGRGSTGSEVAQVECVPTSPAPSVSTRARSRSRGTGTPRSASDWI